MCAMKILCIDVGNTRIHYGVVEGQIVSKSSHFQTRHLASGSYESFLNGLAPLFAEVAGISFCSVVPKINKPLLHYLQSTGLRVFQLTHLNCCGLNLAYPNPGEIGQDRLANAIAAQQYFSIPAIILDMGTAVTLDIVSSAGYEGGIIAPGLAVMTNYLHEQTALLPRLNEDDLLQVSGAIGKSTVHAMQLGVAIGFSGMLDALLTRIFKELQNRDGVSPIVLSTGGSIANLTKEWNAKSQFIENLTLIGLAAAFERTLSQHGVAGTV